MIDADGPDKVAYQPKNQSVHVQSGGRRDTEESETDALLPSHI